MDFLDKALEVAVAAAKEAGRIQMKYYASGLVVGTKEGNVRNLVTNADREADAAVRRLIANGFPEHTIITEEDAPRKGNEYEWHVDPIDGTTNYSRKGRDFCVSIGLAKGSELLAGVVFNPVTSEMYTAVKGKGAFLNGKRMSIAETAKMESAVIYTDLCHEAEKRKSTMQVLGRLVDAKSLRILGSGALAVCSVASGRIDGYFNICGSSWDFAASALMIREAGGIAASPSGEEWTPHSGEGIIATNRKLYPEIFARVKG